MLLGSLVEAARSWPALASATLAGDASGGGAAVDVTSVTHDSRVVEPGALFCCVPGERADGHEHAGAAVAAGAVAVLVERPLALGVAEVQVESVRAAMGPLAGALAGWPSRSLDVVGVTGTNGKTTVTHLLAAILDAAHRSCGVIGTLSGARTTPEAPELQASLAAMWSRGRRAVALEVSSHALAQHRVDGTRFAVGVFTNLSRDHLDYHHDMGQYFQAKARLFEPGLSERAVVCTDDPHGRLLVDAARVPTMGYSLADASDVTLSATGSRFRWRGRAMSMALTGRFNVVNAVAAATVAAKLGADLDAVTAGLAAAGPVAGRFERIDAGQPFTVVVDYAHTPDGLAQALVACRELAEPERSVLVVFGCGGGRDSSKRPLMGAAAAAGADEVIITSDNPRWEDPLTITEAVVSGVTDRSTLTVEPDRRAAIMAAVRSARSGDVVLIAGKGHETTQTIGEDTVAFDDRHVAAEALTAIGWAAGEGPA